MLLLTLIWLAMGLLVGALACGAKLRPASWGKRGWLTMLALGMLAALLSGWLGAWLSGTQYATVTALWVSVLCVCLLSLLFRDQRATPVNVP